MTDPTPAMPEESAALPCVCGHTRDQHTPRPDSTWTGAQCGACPGDDERSWRHAYTPNNLEIAPCAGMRYDPGIHHGPTVGRSGPSW